MVERELLKATIEAINGEMVEEKIKKFDEYARLLIEWNEKFNLTAITKVGEIYQKHFLDSLMGERFIKEGAKGVDVGSGAGFPAIPLLIAREDIKIEMIDSLKKRVGFLEEVLNKLNLTNGTARHARAEEYAATKREAADFVLARAVAPLDTLLEYTVPLARVGGVVVAYKGNNFSEEIEKAKRAMQKLDCSIVNVESFLLEGSQIERSIIVIKKEKPTNIIYPRGQNKPKLLPLK